VGSRVSLQGNLDPCALAADAETIAQKVRELARDAAPARGYIANLGHGCLPDTPVDGVRAFTEAVRALGASFAQRAQVARSPQGREAAAQQGEAERSASPRETEASEDHRVGERRPSGGAR